MNLAALFMAAAAAVLAWPRRAVASRPATGSPSPTAPATVAPTPEAAAPFVAPTLGPVPQYPWETESRLSIRAAPFVGAFRQAESRYGLPPGLLSRVAYQESRYDAAARSPAGALGLMQFMPATAREYGVQPLDPFSSIDGAARYLSALFARFGSWSQALAAYNWGPGNVAGKGLARAPEETRAYYQSITQDVGIT